MSFIDKFKATSKQVGIQGLAFAKQVGTEVQTGGQKALVSFKLENEVSTTLDTQNPHSPSPHLSMTDRKRDAWRTIVYESSKDFTIFLGRPEPS